MKLSPYTYNSTAINDVTNYQAFLPDDMDLQGSNNSVFVKRPENSPLYAAKTINEYTLKLNVVMKGTVQSQLDTLKALFDTRDNTPHKLICKDTANSDKQWYVYCTTDEMKDLKNRVITITLKIADPVWYEETESSDTWAITASGQTRVITPGGNLKAAPRFALTPTSVGGTGFAYKIFIPVRNRVALPYNFPYDLVNNGWDTSALVAYTTNHVLINAVAGIDNAVTTVPYDGEVGTLPTSGLAYLDTEQISYTGKSAAELTGVTRGVNGTTAAAHADNVQIDQSKIQADGDDIRVYFDGVEVNRWLGVMNTANTRVWVNEAWKTKQDLTLGVAIADGGALTSITFQPTYANTVALAALPNAGILQIDTELLSYTAKNTAARTVTGITRGAYGSTAAAHTTLGTAVYWIEHEIWIYYGNSTMSAPETDDTKKPMFNTATSTNISLVYEEFQDDAGLRGGAWKPSLLNSYNRVDNDHKSNFYTGVRTLLADPATEMGHSIYAWLQGALWRYDYATIVWQLYHPAGFTTVTAVGEKYRYTANWPALATIQKSTNGLYWLNAWTTEATPATAQTWTDCAAHNAVALGANYKYLRSVFQGIQGATSNNVSHLSWTSVTLVPDTNYILTGTMGSEQSAYHLQATITNQSLDPDEWIKINYVMALNETITIDCLTKTVTGAHGENAYGALTRSNNAEKSHWFELLAAANTILFEDASTAGLTLITSWRDRNS
jgi:hypothetical protein